MQYSPKLKKVAAELKAILDRENIAGIVILHEPGFIEYVLKIDPPYSCASFDGTQLRIRAKLVEDFNGDKAAWTLKTNDTVNMVVGLGRQLEEMAGSFRQLKHLLDQKLKIEIFPGDHTGHTQQNN